MIGKSLAVIKEVPTQRMYRRSAAARYLGISINALLEIPSSELPVREWKGRRVYLLEDMDKYCESLSRFRKGDKK